MSTWNLLSVDNPALARAALGVGLQNLAVVDLCEAPYNLVPDDDATVALNTALAAVGESGVSSRIYFSKPGDYTLNGDLQTGTVLGYTYNGQVLFPAVGINDGLSVVIAGSAPIGNGGAGRPSNGVRLISNATDGWIFDCIPSHTQFSADNPWTNVRPFFEDIIIQAPTDPQCGGINALTAQSFRCRGLQMRTGFIGGGGSQTGTKEAICLPQNLNCGQLELDVNIRNWPMGIRLSEHTLLQGLISNVKYPLVADVGGDHATHMSKLSLVECDTMVHLEADIGHLVLLSGTVEFEATLSAPTALLSSAGATSWLKNIRGNVSLRMTPDTGGTLPATSELGDISFSNLTRGLPGAKDLHPHDTFTRQFYPQTNPGLSWPTFHPAYVATGSFSVSAEGSLVSTNGTSQSRMIYPAKDRGVTRTVSATMTLDATSPHVRVHVGYIVSGIYALRGFFVDVTGTNLRLYGYVNATTTAYCRKEGAVSLGGTHVITAKMVVDPMGRPAVVSAFVDGVKMCSYYPTEAEREYMVPNPNAATYPVMGDGLSLYEEGSVVSDFRVMDAPADEWVAARGTATLSSGSVTITDAKITANSVVRVWHGVITGSAGSLNAPSLSAGSGFDITADAGSDNNPVYWEVVSY